MSFISNVRAVAYKEATIVRHDKALIGMVVAQPIIMLLLVGYALSYEPANVPWAVLDRDDNGALVRKAGVMSVVIEGGDVRAGDAIVIELPSPPHQRLEPV